MNKFTIILLTSFLAYIQIANTLPMFEVPAHREQKNDNAAEVVDPTCDSNNSPDVAPQPAPAPAPAPESPVDDKGKGKENEEVKAEEDDTAQKSEPKKEERVKNYRNMEDFVHDAIREHMGHQFEFESMSDETEQELYDLFCEMDIIAA